jgi:hypothetical protein
MFAYSTNPSVKTQFSIQKEREEKAARIADEVAMRRDMQAAIARYYSDDEYSSWDLDADVEAAVFHHLHMNKGDRAKRLRGLQNAVVRAFMKKYA